MSKDKQKAQREAVVKVIRGRFVWVGLAFLCLMIFIFYTLRIGNVTGEEVGVLLNKITGKITVVNQSGVQIYNGVLTDFYTLDKTLQTLEISSSAAQRADAVDSLKIKTIDGSDVYVDLRVQYRINAEMADVVISTSGPYDAYKYKWARDYLRAICRNYLGELTTEEFYDAAKRNGKIAKAQQETNERLNDWGINIDSVVMPIKPRFYKEYEAMIKKKKLADQAVLEEQSKAQAAKQRQQTMLVEETNKKNVAVEQFSGQMEQLIIAAQADAEKGRKAADAYYDRVTIGAGALLYEKTKAAEGILAKKRAEAEGIAALVSALEGEGGRNMVKLEYARKLKDVDITGKPYLIESRIERFQHLQGAASLGREKEKEAEK